MKSPSNSNCSTNSKISITSQKNFDSYPHENDYILCLVCYYRDDGYSGQLGLAWLGEVKKVSPNSTIDNFITSE